MPHNDYDPQYETGGSIYDSRNGYFPYRSLDEFLKTLPEEKIKQIEDGLDREDLEIEVQNKKYTLFRNVDGQTFCKLPKSASLQPDDPYVPVWQNISTGIIFALKDNYFVPYLSETFPKVKSYEVLGCVQSLCDNALAELEAENFTSMPEFGENLQINLYRGIGSIIKLHIPDYYVDYDAVMPSIFYNPFDANKSIGALNDFVRLVHKLKSSSIDADEDITKILSNINLAIQKAVDNASEESSEGIILHIIKEDLNMARTLDGHMKELTGQLDALIIERGAAGANDRARDELGINFLVRYKEAIEKYNSVVKDVLTKKDSDPNIVEFLTTLYSSEEFKSAYLELFVCDRISREVGLQPDIASKLHITNFDFAMTINQRATRLVMPWQQVSDKVSVDIYTGIYNAADNIRQLANLNMANTYVVNPSDFKLFKVNDEMQNNMLLCYALSKRIAQHFNLPAQEQSEVELQNMMAKFNVLYESLVPVVCAKYSPGTMQNICDAIKVVDDYMRYTMPNLDDAANYDMDVRLEKAALAEEYIKYQTYKTGSIDFRKATSLVNEFSAKGIPLTRLAKQILGESKQYENRLNPMEHMSKHLFQKKLSSIPVVDKEVYLNTDPVYTITDVHWDNIRNDIEQIVTNVEVSTGVPFQMKYSASDRGAIEVTREIQVFGKVEEQKQITLKNNDSTLSAVLGPDIIRTGATLDAAQSEFFTGLINLIKEHSKGDKIEISNCVGRPEVARKMFQIAKDAGMEPVYKNDGSDPRNILKRNADAALRGVTKRLRGP